MLLGDIVDEISERTAHTLSDKSIVRKIDQLQKQLFRDYIKDADVSYWDLLTGQAVYPLDFPWQDIQEVVVYDANFNGPMDGNVNGHRRTLRKGRPGEYSFDPYYYILRSTIGIWPTPKTDVTQGLQVLRAYIPETLSENILDSELEIDSEYQMLLVYGVVKDISLNEVNREYTDRYMDLLDKFRKSLIDYVPTQITSVTGW